MKTQQTVPPIPSSVPTPESAWAYMQECNRFLTEKFAETDKKISKILGEWSNNFGQITEEYFFNSFEKGQKNFFGERFDDIKKNLKGAETDDEYDILLINGESLGIIEVKFKAHKNDIEVVLKKAETFRINFPKYSNHKIYLGLASMSFYPELELACKENGIAVIKQVGDTVVIIDEGLKAY